VLPESKLPTTINYFLGNGRKWERDIPSFAAVRYKNVYPGIDLRYYGSGNHVEYDLQLAPGRNARLVTVHFSHVKNLSLSKEGGLEIHLKDTTVIQERPVAYQMHDGSRQQVECDYVQIGPTDVSFQVGPHDATLPLTIDPSIVSSTFVDGNYYDDVYKISADLQGNLCFLGRTDSTNLALVNPLQSAARDIFVGKVNSAGVVTYLTYVGSGLGDFPYGIAIDPAGSCYVMGETTSATFPTTPGAFQTSLRGSSNYFVLKLSSAGNSLVYSTYLGGTGSDGTSQILSGGIAVDSSGSAYVTGTTNSSDFPTTSGAYQTTPKGLDAFITKLNPTGSALVFSTRLGGGSDDTAQAIALDLSGNCYVTGFTASTDYPVTVGAPQTTGKQRSQEGAVYDAFVTKLNSSGSALVYSTFLGGSNQDTGFTIAVDSGGNAYVGGNTNSPDFPTTPGAYQPALAGASNTSCYSYGNNYPCFDFFVTKINSTGTALLYSTFVGGTQNEGPLINDTDDGAIALDGSGDVYIVSKTNSPDLPVTPGAIQSSYQGGSDAFVCKLNSSGSSMQYCTYLGGSGDDYGNGAALASSGNVYVSGSTSSSNFPSTTLGSLAFSAGFILKISDTAVALSIQTPSPLPGGSVGTGYSQTLSAVGGTAPYSAWTVSSGTIPSGLSLNSSSGVLSGTPSSPGTFSFTVQVSDSVSAKASKAFVLTIVGPATNSVTVGTSPSGLQVMVDGVTLTAPQSFQWSSGTNHTIGVTSPQSNSGTQYVFNSWSDGGAQTHTIVAPSAAATYTASFMVSSPTPTITSLNPSSATAGGPTFTLTINGTGFITGATAQLNGTVLSTTFLNSNQLTAIVPSSAIATPRSGLIQVINPGGTASNAFVFTINASIAPSITSLSPNSAGVGGAAFTLTVNGSGFLSGSTVQWNGSALATSYLNASQLAASISANLIASVGSATVTVVNPGGTTSNSVTFTINTAGSLSIITASLLPAGTVGAPYSQALAATGGVTPYKSWTVITGNLPPGISLTTLGGVLTSLLNGVPTTPGTFTFTVQVTDNANATVTKQFSLTINGGALSISGAGIVNAASYAGGSVSPGEIVAIFGSGLGPSTLVGLQLDSRGHVSTSLAGTQVLFDGVAAPMIYTQVGQVSVVVPYEVSGKSTTQVQVVYQGQNSNLVSMPVSAVMPGIFTIDASGHGPGAILNQDGTVNSASNPASVGSYVFVYATGEGQTNPGGIDGKPGDSPAPVPVIQPVTATVGGLTAQVQYAGGVPGLVAGVLQVNVQVPAGVTAGSSVPVVITIGGQSSQANVTVAIE
jgi:uncharacterized protein (TIGR03437 family)